ncbi:MAG: ABC transporter ATP-binding protein [Tepidimonas sp.]|uniref:metal ABC transporter ATP-binding protein n=1 Tax=Tepidimonas sp. TaxID=2002775 RepID=UPI00259F1909|nr:ABC transporter ATP-binding protein [Tepidimonas sp.]MDM7456687.1 ABC transporter ATP-binding protein [Tepidimonas sp.]
MSPSDALRFEDVDFAYGEAPVLRAVSFSVPLGSACALVGPNGGGKSTVLKLALGLLAPQRGRIRVLGAAPEVARPRVGYVPQFAQFQRDFPLRVRDVVLQGTLRGMPLGARYGQRAQARAEDALRATDTADLAERPIAALSGGQLQRVLIARALAGEPDLLLLDEPTAHIDSHSQGSLFDLLAAVRGTRSIIMVSHDLHAMTRWADHLICLSTTVRWAGQPAENPGWERVCGHAAAAPGPTREAP